MVSILVPLTIEHDLVSLAVGVRMPYGVGLAAILTISIWLAPRAGKLVRSALPLTEPYVVIRYLVDAGTYVSSHNSPYLFSVPP